MRIVTVTNQKGGVGKTTLACHLALAGVEKGRRTLLVDLDTQGNASTMLARSAEIAHRPGGSAALFSEATPAPLATDTGVDLLHGHQRLDEVDQRVALAEATGIRERLQALPYELVVVDTPPALGLRHLGPQVWADVVVTPLEPNSFSLLALEPDAGRDRGDPGSAAVAAEPDPDQPLQQVLRPAEPLHRRPGRARRADDPLPDASRRGLRRPGRRRPRVALPARRPRDPRHLEEPLWRADRWLRAPWA